VVRAEQHLFDELFTGREVVVDRRCLNFGVFGDIREPRPGKSLGAQDMRRRVEDAGTGARGLELASIVAPSLAASAGFLGTDEGYRSRTLLSLRRRSS
jgi:hypothetical protein